MRYIILLLICFPIYLNSQCLDNVWEPMDPNAINWNDPVYKDFFSNSCQSFSILKSDKNIVEFDQCDKTTPWWNYAYGADNCKNKTICGIGCALTCMCMIARNTLNDILINPLTFQDWMNSNNGFSGCGVLWGAIGKYPNSNIKFNGFAILNNDFSVIKNHIDNKGFVIACVYLETYSHKILIFDYTGEGTKASDFIVSDPATQWDVTNGKHRTLSYYSMYDGWKPEDNKYNLVFYLPKPIAPSKPKASFNIFSENFGINSKEFYIWNKILLSGPSFRTKSSEFYCKEIWVITNLSTGYQYYNTFESEPLFEFDTPGVYSISHAVMSEEGFDSEVIGDIIVKGQPSGTAMNSNWVRTKNPNTPVVVIPGGGTASTCGNGSCDSGETQENCLDCVPEITNFSNGYYLNGTNRIMNYFCPGDKLFINFSFTNTIRKMWISRCLVPVSCSDDPDCSSLGELLGTCKCEEYMHRWKLSVWSNCDENFVCQTEKSIWFTWKSLPLHTDIAYYMGNFVAGKNYIIKVGLYPNCNLAGGLFEQHKFVTIVPENNINLTGNISTGIYNANDLITVTNAQVANGSNVRLYSGNSIKINSYSSIKGLFRAKSTPYSVNCSNLKSASVLSGNNQEELNFNRDEPVFEKSKSKKLNVYPNPTTGILFISTPDNNFAIQLFDSYGKPLNSYQGKSQIDISNYPVGIYFIKIKIGDELKVFKVIKI